MSGPLCQLVVSVPLGLGPRPRAQLSLQYLPFHRVRGGDCILLMETEFLPVGSPMHHSLGPGPASLTPELTPCGSSVASGTHLASR